MEAGEIGGAFLFLLAAAAAVAVAVSVGAVDFSRSPTAGVPLGFQEAVSWLIGVLDGTSSAAADVYGAWVAVRAGVIAPVLQVAVWACMVMSVMLVVEAVYNSVVSLAVKVIGWRPEWRFKWEPLDGDEEKGTAHYPLVLVQIPMYNELEGWGFFLENLLFGRSYSFSYQNKGGINLLLSQKDDKSFDMRLTGIAS